MPRIVFIDRTGGRHEVEGRNGQSIMQAAIENLVPGIVGECGGCASCATCHGLIDVRWLHQLVPQKDDERELLEGTMIAQPNSRLTCQVPMTPALDGIEIQIPADGF